MIIYITKVFRIIIKLIHFKAKKKINHIFIKKIISLRAIIYYNNYAKLKKKNFEKLRIHLYIYGIKSFKIRV